MTLRKICTGLALIVTLVVAGGCQCSRPAPNICSSAPAACCPTPDCCGAGPAAGHSAPVGAFSSPVGP
jgi:hypothetical protein